MRTLFRPRYAVLVIFFLLVVLYTLYQARALILGPRISIENPIDGATVNSPVVTIEGWARDTAWLNLNGRQIFTDESGSWSEKLIVQEGVSIMTVHAQDRFGRETEERLHIVFKQS